MAQKKSLQQWLSEYGESHQNPYNRILHKICVPVIFWTIVSFLYLLEIQNFPFGLLLSIVALGFYFRLSVQIGLIMMVVLAGCFYSSYWVQNQTGQLLGISAFLFVVAWIGQFVGHHIEGRKPSFLQDLQFLLIGPLWVFKSSQE